MDNTYWPETVDECDELMKLRIRKLHKEHSTHGFMTADGYVNFSTELFALTESYKEAVAAIYRRGDDQIAME